MIKVIADGVIGVRVNGRLRPMTRADGAFEAEKDVEAMLVEEGHAVFVDEIAQNDGESGKKPTKTKRKSAKKKAETTDDGETPPKIDASGVVE